MSLITSYPHPNGVTPLPNENGCGIYPRSWAASSRRLVIIAVHGSTGSSYNWLPNAGLGPNVANPQAGGVATMTLVARGGYFVLGVEAGGTENWGNPTAVARILDAYNYAMNTLKSSSAKVGLMGYSMGGLGAANFLKQYPQYLSGVWLWEPVLDLQFANSTAVPYTPPYSTAFQASQYNGNTSGNLSGTSQWAGFLATAYPSGFTASDPMQNIAAFRNLGVPTTITANLDDNGLPHGQMEYFVSQVNDSHITLFTPQGLGAHDSPGPMGPGAGTMGPTPALSFFRGLSW